MDERCIACGSPTLQHGTRPQAWMCGACGYQNDAWREAAAEELLRRSMLVGRFDAAARALHLPLLAGLPEASSYERVDFEGGAVEAGFADGHLVALRFHVRTEGFEAALVRGYWCIYDDWAGTLQLRADATILETEMRAIHLDDHDEEVWFASAANGEVLRIGTDRESWVAALHPRAVPVAHRNFETPTET